MSYVFRKWRQGDRLPSNWVGKPPPELTYVLFFSNLQIGAAILGGLGPNNILFIEIFEPYRRQGHGRVFVNYIEKEVKRMGHDYITAFPVIDDTFWAKLGFELEKIIDGDKLMKKKI